VVDAQTLTQIAAMLGADGVQRDLHKSDGNTGDQPAPSLPSDTIRARIEAAQQGDQIEARPVGLQQLEGLQDFML
jgi:hypothetical protein